MMQQASTQTVQRGRIIRDDQGNILSVEIPDENPENTSSCTPWGKPFEAETAPASIQPKTTLVKSLESLSETATKKIVTLPRANSQLSKHLLRPMEKT